MPKIDVLAGVGEGPVGMMKQILGELEREGGEVLGIVVFAKNERTSELHTYIGSKLWPHDIDAWTLLSDALRRTVDDARADTSPADKYTRPTPLRRVN